MTDEAGEENPPRFLGLARDSTVYALGSMAGKAIGALLLPVLSRRLTPGQFGRYDVLSSLASALVSALLIGLDVATTRIYPTTSTSERRTLHTTWFAAGTAVTLVPALALVVFAAPVSDLLFGTADEATSVATIGVSAVVGVWFVMVMTTLRNQRRPGAHALVNTAQLLLNGVFAVVLLFAWRQSVAAVLLATLASVLIATCAAFLVVRDEWWARPSRVMARRLLALGLPLAPTVAATWFADFGNRAILLGAAGDAEVGLFSVAFRFASLGLLMVTGFQLAWQPHAFAIGTSPEGRTRIAREGLSITLVLTIGLVAVALVAPELVRVVAGPAFHGAVASLSWQLVYALAVALFLLATMPSQLASTMRDVGAAGLVAVAIALGVNVLLAPRFGAVGTSAAMATGQSVGVAVAHILGNRRSVVPYAWGRILTIALAGSIAILFASTTGAVLVRAALGAVVVVVVMVEGTLPQAVGERLRGTRSRPR